MKTIVHKNNTYTLIKRYQHIEDLRLSFNNLMNGTFGFDLEHWYKDGYWNENYIPYSLIINEQVIANVSVNRLSFKYNNQVFQTIQLGTIMVDKEFRNQGLSKILMNEVLAEYKDQVDFIYLFANDSVLEYYPKFGFKQSIEYQAFTKNIVKTKHYSISQLDINLKEHNQLIMDLIDTSNFKYTFQPLNHKQLVLFYLTSFYKDNIFFIKDLNTICIAEYNNDELLIMDVFSNTNPSLEEITQAMMLDSTKTIKYGFTPNLTSNVEYTILQEDNTTLFILKEHPFLNHKIMFPLLTHA